MFGQKQVTINVHVNWQAVLYGTLFALSATVVLMIISSIIMFYARIADVWQPLVSAGILSVSVFAGGIFSSIKAGQKGLIHGIAVGIALLIIMSLLTWFLPASLSWSVFFKKVFYALAAGALGGILGVK